MKEFQTWAQQLGEAAFKAPLGDDGKYWNECKGRWGLGPGYRDDIKNWTRVWFEDMSREERRAFIEAEIQKRWKALLAGLEEKLSSGERGVIAEGPGSSLERFIDHAAAACLSPELTTPGSALAGRHFSCFSLSANVLFL